MSDSFDLDLGLAELRDAVHAPSDGGEATRQRVLAGLAQQAVRQKRLQMAASVLAVFVACSTALAYFLVSRTERDDVAASVRVPRSAPEEVVRAPVAAPRPVVVALPAQPPPEPVKPRPARRRAVMPAALAPTREARGVEEPPVVTAPAPEPAQVGQELSANELHTRYMEAHRQHFRGAPAAALAAWDRYLAGNPRGPAAAEARFNRAIALLRLGRTDDARAALEPFARGDYGEFRKADARRLLGGAR